MKKLVISLIFLPLPYFAGAMTGAILDKGYVTFEDLKLAVAYLIEEVNKLKKKIEKLEKQKGIKTMVVVKEGARVRLYPWGKVLGVLPKGTKVIVFSKQGEFYITNLGFIHESLLEEEDGRDERKD